MMEFEPGEYFVYVNGEKYELGKVKRINNTGNGYFCWYHEGDTAANTPLHCMHKLINGRIILKDGFGSADVRNTK